MKQKNRLYILKMFLMCNIFQLLHVKISSDETRPEISNLPFVTVK